MGTLTVVAIGGNALLDPTLPPTIANQFAVTARAMRHIADFIQSGGEDDRVVLTHGNGPQVGFKALRSQISRLASLLPGGADESVMAAEFNRQTSAELCHARDFALMHYRLNGRDGEEFWDAARKISIPA